MLNFIEFGEFSGKLEGVVGNFLITLYLYEKMIFQFVRYSNEKDKR